MYYAIYKRIRDGAWQCLLDNGIKSLPVDVLGIARRCNIRVVKNSAVNELLPDELGKTYYSGDEFMIIYNDLNDTATSRFAIAHELGHIFLGHATTHSKYADVREFDKRPKSEKQADTFALRLLCPACVLMGLDIHSEREISTFCKVPSHWARKRNDRMKEIYKKDRFFHNPVERLIYSAFEEYISDNRKERYGI